MIKSIQVELHAYQYTDQFTISIIISVIGEAIGLVIQSIEQGSCNQTQK